MARSEAQGDFEDVGLLQGHSTRGARLALSEVLERARLAEQVAALGAKARAVCFLFVLRRGNESLAGRHVGTARHGTAGKGRGLRLTKTVTNSDPIAYMEQPKEFSLFSGWALCECARNNSSPTAMNDAMYKEGFQPAVAQSFGFL